METVELDALSDSLREIIPQYIGKYIKFSNGCYVSLSEDVGMFWGTTPYGLDWGCNADDAFIDSITDFVSYWNDPRDERGQLIDL